MTDKSHAEHFTTTLVHKQRERSKTNNSYNRIKIVECNTISESEDIKEEINEEENVDDPLCINQETQNICEDRNEENQNKDDNEDMFDYDKIDIEEFKIEPDINEDKSEHNNLKIVNNPILVNNIDE